MKQNWDWVRATYSPQIGSRQSVIDEPSRFPSCIANGLSEREKRALMKVFNVAWQRAEARHSS